MSGHKKALKARRRMGPPDRITAHRRFTTLQRDPTGKVKLRYAREKRRLCDRMAIEAIIRTWATEANGLKTDKAGRLRRAKRIKSNGLAAWIIEQYEEFRRKGHSSAAALSFLDHQTIMAAVDSGRVGKWCARKSANKTRVVAYLDREFLRNEGPRISSRKAEKARNKKIGNAFRAKLESARMRTSSGKSQGEVIAQTLDILQSMQIPT